MLPSPSPPGGSSPPSPEPPPPPPSPPAPEAELGACSKAELVRRLRAEEAARLGALARRGRLMAGVNRQLQAQLAEVRQLKAANGRLQAENRQLRDLCAFLDQERLQAQRRARHWQLFGRHAARALRHELDACLAKLGALEALQQRLAGDNLALKELCLALDRQRLHDPGDPAETPTETPGPAAAPDPCGPRDLGDGSSSTGSLGSPEQLPQPTRTPAS